jgi:hypothetical protein
MNDITRHLRCFPYSEGLERASDSPTPCTRVGTGRNYTSLCCENEGLPTDSNTNFMKIRRLGTVMTDRPTDMTKLMGAFRYSCERAYKQLPSPSTSFHIRLQWSSGNSMICNTSICRLHLTFEFDIQRIVHRDIFL